MLLVGLFVAACFVLFVLFALFVLFVLFALLVLFCVVLFCFVFLLFFVVRNGQLGSLSGQPWRPCGFVLSERSILCSGRLLLRSGRSIWMSVF